MECPKCGAVNEAGAGSCVSCGTAFADADEGPPTRLQQKVAQPKPAPRLSTSNVPPKQCPSCNTLNAATFKFCARCGAALNATAAPVSPPARPPAKAPTPAPYAPPAAAPPAPAAPARPAAKAPTTDARPPTMFAAAGSLPDLAEIKAAAAAIAASKAAAARPAAAKPAAPAAPAAKPAAPAAPGKTAPPPVKPAAAAPAPAPAPAAAAPAAPPAPAAAKPAPPVRQPPPGAKPLPPKAPPPVRPPPTKPRARVSAIARDGSRSADFLLTRDETRVGRAVATDEVKLDKDPFIAPLHAVFRFDGEQLTVQDSGTANGVFLWLKARELAPGDELRVGRQRLRIEWLPEEPETVADQPLWGSPDPGYAARAVQLLEGGGEGDVFPLKAGDNLIGRGTGDVSFPHDGYVSSRHATISVGDGALSVKDMGSANGTFVRIAGAVAVATGDLLLVGEQILRIDPA